MQCSVATPSIVYFIEFTMPSLPGEELMVAFPLVLPMGWVSSPPYFCALTNDIIATILPLTISLALSIPWLMMPLAFGICLTLLSCFISILSQTAATLEIVDTLAHHEFRLDHELAMQAFQAGVVPTRSHS
jgi:hypothetical protein